MDKQLTSKNIVRDLLSDTTFNKSNFNISPTMGKTGRPLDERDPLKHITADLRSEKLILDLIKFRVLL